MNQSVAGIAVRDNHIFLAKRLPGGSLGGKWEFPGGKVEPGETLTQALVREYREEFEAEISVGKELCRGSFIHHGVDFELTAFRIDFLDDELVLNEHSEIKWVPIGDLDEYQLADSDHGLLKSLLPALETFL